MTKAEIELNRHWCHIRCLPKDKSKCSDCAILSALKSIYEEQRNRKGITND